MEQIRRSPSAFGRLPHLVGTALIGWTIIWAVLVAVASVPAYRPRWTASWPASPAGTNLLVTDPLTPFTTPYVSFVRVRLAPADADHVKLLLISGIEPVSSRASLDERTLLTLPLTPSESAGPGEFHWNGRTAVQFGPSDAVSAAVVAGAAGTSRENVVMEQAAITVGHDGQSGAVSVVHYWWPWMFGIFLLGLACLAWPATWEAQKRTINFWRRVGTGHRPLVALLAVAAILRLVLALRGGQYFDWDENRYVWGVRLFDLLATGNLRQALDLLLSSPDHPGFRIVSLGLALFQVSSAWPTGHPIADPRDFSGEWLPACILSLASVCSIGLTYGIARRTGATMGESFLAAFLLAASSAMLMHARHFFPYDAAMATLLMALWIGLKPDARPVRSYVVGLLAGFGFLVYTGYWLLATVVGLVYIIQRPLAIEGVLRRAVFFGLGGVTMVGAPIAAGFATGRPFLDAFVDTSRGILSGDFSEGWSLPWAYFWNADSAVLIVYIAAILAAARQSLHGGWRESVGRLRWVWCAAAVYGGLVLGAHVFRQFVVYDRLARQMLPFMCLAAAPGLAPLADWRVGRTSGLRIVQGVVVLLFAVNAWPLFHQRFPREIVADVMKTYGEAQVRLDTTVFRSVDVTAALFLPVRPETIEARDPGKRYVLLNAKDIWTEDKLPGWKPPPRGPVLLQTPHPRQLRALQYQGYTPGQRLLLRHIDFSIQLIDTQAARP
jgi:hypothetical protein